MIKDQNGKLVTDPTEKANSLNSYYASLFSSECNNQQIQSTESGKPSTISINITRKQLTANGKKKSVGPDGIPGEILKLGGEAMIPYLTRLLDITINNNAIPGDWIKGIVVPTYKGGRSIVSWELQTSRLNLGGLQKNGARYSWVPNRCLGNE